VPEGLEAEIWRGALDRTVGRRITGAWTDERVSPAGFAEEVTGTRIERVRRAGKVILVDTDGPTIGVHLGMTGRVVVDGEAPIERLQYASGRDRPEWDRLRLSTDPAAGTGVPAVRLNDPRRLGRISLDPDVAHLGPDMLVVTAGELFASLHPRHRAVKSVLLDQAVVAGLGNMCADEVLWWASIAPHRPASSLEPDEVTSLVTAMRRRLPIMLRRGGSSTGVLSPQVRAGCPPCERDGGALRRDVIGGRTAVWCPEHQR
jgi:formamidopyrimidine-DNA glycosylase